MQSYFYLKDPYFLNCLGHFYFSLIDIYPLQLIGLGNVLGSYTAVKLAVLAGLYLNRAGAGTDLIG